VIYQSLVGSVAIGAELDRKDRSLISRNCDRRGLKPLDAKTDPRTRFNGWSKKKNKIGDFILEKYM
jgi:hypothetical protein